jgi:hypothetical protein
MSTVQCDDQIKSTGEIVYKKSICAGISILQLNNLIRLNNDIRGIKWINV